MKRDMSNFNHTEQSEKGEFERELEELLDRYVTPEEQGYTRDGMLIEIVNTVLDNFQQFTDSYYMRFQSNKIKTEG